MKKWQILLSSLFLTAFIVPVGFGIYIAIEQISRGSGYVLENSLTAFCMFFMLQLFPLAFVIIPTSIAYHLLAYRIPLKMKFIAYPLLGFGITALCCTIFCTIEPAAGYEDILEGIMLVSIPYVLLFSLCLIGFETGYIQRFFSRKTKQV
jgi:hypothetical protein